MSRLSKKPMLLPNEVDVSFNTNLCTITGALGSLELLVYSAINLSREDQHLYFSHSNSKASSAQSGLLYSLIKNAITGVTKGHSKVLELKGLGYRCNLENGILSLSLGYSHKVIYEVPSDVQMKVEKDTIITITGIDKQRVGQVAAEIRAYKIPDNYHAKGILYQGEVIITKEGKKK